MTVESASFISQLNTSYPQATDLLSEGDDHIRLTKSVLKTQFPNFGTTAITATAAEVNYSVGLTGSIQSQLNALTAGVNSLTAGGVAVWVSGGSYTAGQVRYSPITLQNYRAKTTHSGLTTDPSADSTNWSQVGGGAPDFLLIAQGIK